MKKYLLLAVASLAAASAAGASDGVRLWVRTSGGVTAVQAAPGTRITFPAEGGICLADASGATTLAVGADSFVSLLFNDPGMSGLNNPPVSDAGSPPDAVCTLDGRPAAASDFQSLPAGIYIVCRNGKAAKIAKP